ncbi:MAG: hypothetical protein IPM51_08175 [Sphingobacteriaceae bacterium]|nr:hypothetical protein [Sphingobacteriaceae bacterium]
MKKLLLLTLCLVFNFYLNAQDIIVKSDGSIIKGKITEVGEETIKYKKADNPDGPTYSVSKSNLSSINYENGDVEKFTSSEKKASSKEAYDEDKMEDEDREEKPVKKGPSLAEEPGMKNTIEGIAKDVGEQLLRSCANGKIDNSTSEVYWDQTFRDAITKEISIAMRTSWKPKWTDGAGKWIKGKVVVGTDGSKKWVYQNDHGLTFSGCAKGFRIK